MHCPSTHRFLPVRYSFFALLIIPFYSVCAQESPANPEDLEELVVTGSLSPIAISEIASSVTIIDRQQIEQRQLRYLADLLRDVPGFSVSRAGGVGSQTQVRVRGTEANHMLVLMDGVRANDPAQVDEFQYQYALTSDIERIEIVRGPQSATWGTDAMAGVINIIRRDDSTAQYLTADAEVGSFGTGKIGIDGSLVRETVRMRAGFTRLETDGINISREGDEKDGAENSTANASLEWRASEAIKLLVNGTYIDASSDFDAIDFFVTGLPTDADRVSRNQQGFARAELAYDPAGSRWSGSASANWTDSTIENFADGEFDTSTAAETLDYRLRASINLNSVQSDNHVLSFALDRRDVDFSQRGLATAFGDPNQDQSYDVTGLAAEYVGKPRDNLTWSLSGRQDQYSEFDDATTWRVAGSWYFTDSTRVRGSMGTGSKVPTFTERFGFFSDFFVGNPDLKPESSTSWEVGLETGWQDGRYTLGAAYFDQDLEDEIDGFVFDPASGGFTARNKDSGSERKGVEIIFGARLLESLTINASYTYVDATETGALGETVKEVRRPENMASLNGNFRFAEERGNVNLNISYNGSQLDNFFPPATFALEQVTLPGYTLVDIAASWRLTDSIEVTGRIENLLDEAYEEVLGFSTPGRAVYGGIRARFGD